MRKIKFSATWLLVILLAAAEAPAIWYWALNNHFVYTDAISRTANAFYVLHTRDPHLGAIGFVWNPLPSFLQLPILAFWKWWPSLAADGISGMIVTALFNGFGAAVIYGALRSKNVPLAYRVLWTLLYAFHPFIYVFGSNGMSESIFALFILLSIRYLIEWMDEQNMTSAIVIGFSLCLAFLTRYEAIPFAAAVLFGCLLVQLRPNEGLRRGYSRFEATLILLILPMLFAVLMWLWFNYTIMGNAFYFLNSNYSNVGQSVNLNEFFLGIKHNVKEVIFFVVKQSVPFLAPLAVVILFRLLSWRLFRKDVLILGALIVSIPTLQFYMLYQGISYGWLRFFFYPLPIVVIWLGREWHVVRPRLRHAFAILMCAAIAASGILSYKAMNNPRMAPEEYSMLHFQEDSLYEEMKLSRAIATSLDDILTANPDSLVLLDSFGAAEIVVSSTKQKQMVVTSDRDFKQALKDPAAYGIKYMLVPDPSGLDQLNAINIQYPALFRQGMSGWTVAAVFGDRWKLFEAVDSDKSFSPQTSR
ncbi:hypothetical protein J19TS2_24700 [Cohnella xylanilytica]|uniref:Glycosyltransferase family 39 protein n=1 Tax=Cohnella xylanilytica TaxID=557555 RepID=A0A841U069_9BACL|nr:glycosyltransferase family 39 protein [Cohnella xylanilytica]MBB6691520.1 glycosyltransferase family 39 protein [Cohnella xylanilytica]GIO12915.1 hypothetical protein J19TS2_24700 [Cohnella xylanilytica]